MTDAYGRTIDYLRLSVTDLCNLRCVYCMPSAGVRKRAHGDLCAFEELTELAAACVELGVKKLRLTGGEPLVRRGIVSLVEMLNALRPLGLRELTMTTNGVLLPELAAPLRAAGLDRLNVSLDTLRPDRYRALTGGGELDRVLAGIAAAEAAGFSDLRLNAVLLRGVNDDELRDLALLAKDHPWSVRFIELMPLGPGAALTDAFLPAQAVLAAVPELAVEGSGIGDRASGIRDQAYFVTLTSSGVKDQGQAKAFPLGGRCHPASPASRMTDEGRSDDAAVAQFYAAPGWAGTVGLIAPMSVGFCASCSRLRLTADGKLKPCLHSAQEFPLRGLHGEALKAAILAAVARKPARHHLSDTQPSESARPMNEIGG